MYRIGEFSYLFKVTIKTLRHYDKIDLFKPAFTDPYTGYRYYKEEQKEEFSNILKFKIKHKQVFLFLRLQELAQYFQDLQARIHE